MVVTRCGLESAIATGMSSQLSTTTMPQRTASMRYVLTRTWPSARLSFSARNRKIAATVIPAAAMTAGFISRTSATAQKVLR